MNPYTSFANASYSDIDIAREMGSGGGWPAASRPYRQQSYTAGYPVSGSVSGNRFADLYQESVVNNAQAYNQNGGAYPQSMSMSGDYGQQSSSNYPTISSNSPQTGKANQPAQLWDYEMQSWLQTLPGERVVDQWYEQAQLVGQREIGRQYAYVKKPYITMEKVMEVPQTIVKETTKEVSKPEIVERIIEVPKIEYMESRRVGPTKYETKEQVVEVPQVAWEEHVRHVPRLEVQERLIEVPKVEFREVIEYEDRVEYREVLVDKIVEVPEIEYRIRKVEHFVPQTYVQENYVERYQEVPIVQVQEVERQEFAPVHARAGGPGAKSSFGY
mmetsp:Transcript_59726/g.142106  ORF Transcript_59726/g.142106 Transcript_59726/m.142106 type:complete len:329 (-) Transcript_59726:99-1085(-)|eukprot:CAMPEP_0178417994 /NCGR_PEP_ID=MMETSP0689_2-20121128/24859_1 /TAXON_ID=160604 /ORGANISM="Amphidinium massartii, Strain CS-259" /LENGTH=328 /DNA_ID=CAMNT_0020039373 /DNA_START=104 /DNA_END=1090 /DNA_ORIENTATION=+